MLKVFNPEGNDINNFSGQWKWFTGYDDQGRVILQANPSAISGYWENAPDLMNFQNGNYAYLRDTAGLMTGFEYTGGYLTSVDIRQGEFGAWVSQNTYQYISHSGSGGTIKVLASSTVYRNNNSGDEQTTYVYTWFDGTDMPSSVTVTSPKVTYAQNGSNIAAVDVTITDT